MILTTSNFIQQPLVSVLMITYNQEKTIAQAIESVLNQEGNFSLEIVIGEDAGTDQTRQICIDYQRLYPDVIKLLLQEENQGVLKNFVDTIRLCKGEYIAICAGDDYWIDQHKIEKQLNFLTNHPDFGVVSTDGYRLIIKNNKLLKGLAPLNPEPNGNVFPFTWKGGVYATPSTLLLKSELLKFIDFDEFIRRKFFVEDVPLQAILAKHTKFGKIPDLCVVYRVNHTSLTFTNVGHPAYLAYHEGLVAIRRYLHELYPDEVHFSDTWAHDYMVYRRFLMAVYHFHYKEARQQLSKIQKITPKEKRALQLTSTHIGFWAFCIAKRIKLLKYKTS
jgi:glycosyltransferase involved in cell wall biosynthesis